MSSQYLPNGEPKDAFTIGMHDLAECRNNVLKYFNIVKLEMSKIQKTDPEKYKALHSCLVNINSRMGNPVLARAAQEQHAASQQQPPPPPPSAPASQPALNANNLQKHEEQLAEARRTKLAQTAGRMSPDGSSPIVIRSAITVNDLKLPDIRKRKLNDTPQDSGSPSKMRSPKTAQTMTPRSPQVKSRPSPEVEKNFKCIRTGCIGAYAIERELQEHQRQHEREDQKARFMKSDPLQYTLNSVAAGLHLNNDGTPKDAKPQVSQSNTNGLTPTPRSILTPKSKSPAQVKMPLPVRPVTGSKAIAADGDQLPTPPESFWDVPGTPDALRQCFTGIPEEVSALAAMDTSFFTPAHTPEDSPDESGKAVVSTYGEWNPFAMKDTCGSEILQDIGWDGDVPVCSTKDGANWGAANGFAMFCELSG